MLISLIVGGIVIVLIIISIAVYRKKHTNHTQTPVEIIATNVAERATNMFSSTPSVPAVIRSIYFPDQLYVSKTVKLDSSLKVMFTNLLFGFPDAHLVVEKFQYFEIDGNRFEEVVFEKIGPKNYIMLHDSYEETNYFLNRVMTQGVSANVIPPMASQDEIELVENGQKYLYQDFSGLIEVVVRDELGGFNNQRLIRVYSREITPEDNEFLICMQDKSGVVDYYIGFNISIHQLEDL